MKIRSLLLTLCMSFICLSDINASTCDCNHNCCGSLNKSKHKLKTGFVKLPARTQTFFAGDPICEEQDEHVPAAEFFVRVKGKTSTTLPTIVFIHGFGETGDVWACAQEELSDCYLTVAMDLRGYGKSSKTPAVPDLGGIHYTVDLSVEDIFQVLQKIGITKNIVLVGHSIGSSYAFKYAYLHKSQIFKLVLVAGPPQVTPDCASEPTCAATCFNPFNCVEGFCWPFGISVTAATNLAQPLVDCLVGGGNEKDCLRLWGEFIAPIWFNEPCQDQLRAAQQTLVNSVVSNTPAIINSIFFDAATEDMRPFIPGVKVPTLLTVGSIDAVVNPGTGFFYHANMPNSSLAEFVGKGHQLHVTDFKNFDRLLKQFIQASEFPDYIKVFDEGCCVCPILLPHTCDCSR